VSNKKENQGQKSADYKVIKESGMKSAEQALVDNKTDASALRRKIDEGNFRGGGVV
jgi:hypothetical protein